MMFTKSLSSVSTKDVSIAGGKGASLGEMIKVGIQVPLGFVILSSAFEYFLKETDINVEIDSLLHKVDTDAVHIVENISEQIQSLIKNAEMPSVIVQEINNHFEELLVETVAVRSSATAEDSESAAWAGQLDSYLNVTEKELLNRVQDSWASLFTPRAIFYRFEKDMHKEIISVAVVVQKMVQSESSGIAFSVHPVTEDRNQLIIEAGFGLGEAIVQGTITPDSYVVEKTPRRIIDININTQEKGLFRSEKGNKWCSIPKEKGEEQVLTDKQILELSETILKIEAHYGFPVDVEWALENDLFYITQSRPVTTLSLQGDIKHQYRKIMNRSMYLIMCEAWDRGERVALPALCDNCVFFNPLFVYVPGKAITVYYDFIDPNQDTSDAIKYFNEHEEDFDEIKKDFDSNGEKIQMLAKRKNPEDLEKLFRNVVKIWPVITVSNIFGDEREYISGVKESLINKYRTIRNESDGLLYTGGDAILEHAAQLVPSEYSEWVEFLLLDEVKNKQLPPIEELRKRSMGYIYHNGVLSSIQNIDEYAEKNNITIVEETVDKGKSTGSVKGTIAYKGKMVGRVSVVFEKEDMKKVKKGDVLVTPMTTPSLITAMKKASAFVTDEGGVTSHAAIVAREMKKPCIIGTKIATQVFKDGMTVEVDAERGIITVV